jgi:hypothetical protein
VVCGLGRPCWFPWPMRTRRGRCSIFAVHPASGQLPRVARTAARRAQGPLSGPFGKAYCGVRWWHRERDKIDKIILLAMAQCPVGCGAFDFRGVLSPEGPGSDTSSGCLAQHRGPFSSRSTTSEEAKVKSEGKRTSSSSAGPGAGRRQETIKREIQRCRDNHRTRNRRTVECVWSTSSQLGVWYSND